MTYGSTFRLFPGSVSNPFSLARCRPMIGYNSRETFQDATYDVQTQQMNGPAGSIETHVYRNGKIVATVRSDCPQDAPIASLEQRMSQQHEEICGKVRDGSYELIFLWISRGIIAFESRDYVQALECFESVLSIDETHAEGNAYLERIRDCLKTDGPGRRRVLEGYRKQMEALESSGRVMEAGRKRAILTRICRTPPPPPQRQPGKTGGMAIGFEPLSFLKDWLQGIRGTLLPVIRGKLLPKIMGSLPTKLREDLVQRIQEVWLPKIRDTWLPKMRENLFSKYLLVTFSTLVLMILSGLISADFQIKLDPAYHASLGKEYLEGNRLSPARNLFYEILRQNPESQEALDGFWETFRRVPNYQKAGEMLEALVEGRSASSQIYFYLAEAYRLASRCEEAVQYYEEALARGSPEAVCKIGMGLCLLERQNVTAAIDLWEGLLQRGYEDHRLDYCLGTAYQARGRLGRASVHYSRALQKHPQSGSIYRALGNCLYGLHQEEKAEELWEKAAILEREQATKALFAACPQPEKRSTQGSPGEGAACFPFPLI